MTPFLQRLWAPWRQGYISAARKGEKSDSRICIFCQKPQSKAGVRNLVLAKGQMAFLLLNRYPYSNGHLMVAPYRHVDSLEKVTQEEWLDLGRLVNNGIARLKRVMKPDGFNLGMNLGRVSGAGIPGHLHLHIVPRWNGDTNFMPVLSDTKVISQSLEATYRLLHQAGRHAHKKTS